MIHGEQLYLKLPVPLQNLACSVNGWRIQRSRFGGEFPALLREAEARSKWSIDQVTDYRDQRLREFIRHSAGTAPFYREQFRGLGIAPERIQTLDDLRLLPMLKKDTVQARGADLVSEAVPASHQIIGHTSGTTGGGLRFATTLRAVQEQWAVWWRYRRWHGLEIGTWCGYFSGRSVVPLHQTAPPFWRYNYPGRQLMFSGYHMNTPNMAAYVAELRRKQPPWLHGYPSLLALLAAYIIDTGAALDYPVKWITCGAENLLPQQVQLMERAFGVRPIQHYGMAEAGANISECERGNLHVDEDFSAVEFVRNPDGPGYRVIGTNFTNPATPLVRYDLQDLVDVENVASCSCGRPGRLVHSVDGRHEDYVVLKNGARIGRMDHVFKDLVNIREAQIHQKIAGEITVRIVRGQGYTEADERRLMEETARRVGSDTVIHLEYVDSLDRSRAGKLRFVVSDLPQGELERVAR